MKSMKLRELGFIVCACHLLALTICRGDLEAVEISDEAEMRLIEARAARTEAIKDEEEKPYKDANAATREAALSKHLRGEVKWPWNSPRNATRANQEAVRTVRELMRDDPLVIVRCVKTLRQLWRFQYLLFHVNACASGHCLAFGVIVWLLLLFKRGQRQQLEKLKCFYIPAVCCLWGGGVYLARAWIILAGTKRDDDLHAILVEARLIASDAYVDPDIHWYIYLALLLVTLVPAYFSSIIVLRLKRRAALRTAFL